MQYWPVSIQRADGVLSCGVASLGNPGNVNASSINSILLSELKPKKVLMMGIAGGRRKNSASGKSFCPRVSCITKVEQRTQVALLPDVVKCNGRASQLSKISTPISHPCLCLLAFWNVRISLASRCRPNPRQVKWRPC